MSMLDKQILTEIQLKAIGLLVSKADHGMTDKDIAENVGVDARTLRRWKNENPKFRKELYRQTEEVLQLGLTVAVDWVMKVLAPDSKYKESSQLGAAKLLFQSNGKLKEVVENSATTDTTISVDDILRQLEQKG